jgi:hypothetical protein
MNQALHAHMNNKTIKKIKKKKKKKKEKCSVHLLVYSLGC